MKKGFTLIELLATIVIISIVVSLVIPAVNKTVENNRIDLCNSQLQNIQSAAQLWASDNQLYLPTSDTSSESVIIDDLINGTVDINSEYKKLVMTINFLKNEGYIEEKCENEACYANVYDAIKKQYISGNTNIIITKNKNRFEYYIDYLCQK